ncbi:hypothetical protein ACS47_24240 [Bacillus cereus]|uniref:hypothetical protein n=1 Tax=Bacillus paranthracis TaxID=2026186 RepID=UPI0007728BAF|nr:hypothetical protein ACS47_24240 [Bacillus cereus]SME06786.1 hypothetical protein BACERE00183_01375 [Bacillus cereus]
MNNLDALQLMITKDLGELNDKRKGLLLEKLGDYYKNHDPQAPETILFMYNSPKEEQDEEGRINVSDGLIITSDEITFLKSVEGENAIDVKSIESIVKQIVNVLLLDEDKLSISMELVHNISIEGNSAEKSLEMFGTFGIPNVKATGVNLLVQEMDYNSEFTLRPLVKQANEFVCIEKTRYINEISVGDLESVIVKAIEEFNGRKQVIIQSKS